MEVHSGDGMNSGQHEPIGGGEAVDRSLKINFSFFKREVGLILILNLSQS